MMDNLVIGMAAAALALSIQYFFLRSHRIWLKSHAQSYEFHALRDRLQLLALDGELSLRSMSYDFLMSTINLAIKNAGKMKLRQIVAVMKLVDKRSHARGDLVTQDIQRQSDEVKQLAADTFKALTLMVVRNDSVLYVSRFVLKLLADHYTHPNPATWKTVGKKLLGRPRVEALREVRKYDALCSKLCPSS